LYVAAIRYSSIVVVISNANRERKETQRILERYALHIMLLLLTIGLKQFQIKRRTALTPLPSYSFLSLYHDSPIYVLYSSSRRETRGGINSNTDKCQKENDTREGTIHSLLPMY